MTTPGPAAGKAEWRAWARKRRAGVDFDAVSTRVVAALRSWLPRGATLLVFDPLPDEIDVTALAGEFRCLLTRTPPDGPLTIHPYDSPREEHPFGFSQPIRDAPLVPPTEIDVALVPGLAYDRQGVRLGRGGGHYDRLIGSLRPGVPVVGVAPESLVVETLPHEFHDRRMTHLVTEEGVGRVPPMSALIDTAREWIAGDPDPLTRAALQAAVDAGDEDALEAAMGAPLTFGTAGIRGPVGPGPGRMNRAVVITATAGIVDFLRSEGRLAEPVVVGFDARPDSRRFAEDTIGVLRAAGIDTRCFTDPTPTPVVAHAGLSLGAAMTIVVTASHNPRPDNGYKVYDDNGAQIVPPVDERIAAAIARSGPAIEIPRVEDPWDDVTALGDGERAAYREAVLAFRGEVEVGAPVPVVYTPLHGVGGDEFVTLLSAGGHETVIPVPSQFAPDGTFPTTPFPNPEEEHALDLAERLATERGVDLVLANDPDADRLAVSIATVDGWRRLTGNEIGVLLADFVLERTTGDDRLVINSVVSSPMLGAIATRHGAAFATTLTGFKWICNAALDLEEEGLRFVFGYEEALGYTVGPVVRDKDGLSAGLWFADLVAACRSEGATIVERLARLFVTDGLWVSHQESVTRPGPDGMEEIAAAIDAAAENPPAVLGGLEVMAMTDYRVGAENRPRCLGATPLLEFSLEGGSRVLARPSGTEPKLKVYADFTSRVASEGEVPRARAAGLDLAIRAASELVEHMGMA